MASASCLNIIVRLFQSPDASSLRGCVKIPEISSNRLLIALRIDSDRYLSINANGRIVETLRLTSQVASFFDTPSSENGRFHEFVDHENNLYASDISCYFVSVEAKISIVF